MANYKKRAANSSPLVFSRAGFRPADDCSISQYLTSIAQIFLYQDKLYSFALHRFVHHDLHGAAASVFGPAVPAALSIGAWTFSRKTKKVLRRCGISRALNRAAEIRTYLFGTCKQEDSLPHCVAQSSHPVSFPVDIYQFSALRDAVDAGQIYFRFFQCQCTWFVSVSLS